jgi:hypothetical protein
VVIRCPACGAAEEADAATLADAPTIVCRKCGETWPGAERRKPRALALAGSGMRDEPRILESEKRPLVTYSEGVDKAWAKKMEGDVLPEPPRRSRTPSIVAATAAIMFVAAFLGGRESAVAALPELAGLYAALGMSVNLDKLTIEGVEAERTTGPDGARLTVRGSIRNAGAEERPVPPLTASLLDGTKAPAGAHGFDPPKPTIGPGEVVAFMLEIDDAPDRAAEVTIGFRRPAELVSPAAEDNIPAP